MYCNHVWGNTYSTYLYRLEILQKRAVRLICSAAYLGHTSELFKTEEILKVKEIYLYVTTILMYKIYYRKSIPLYLSMFTRNYEIHSIPTRQFNLFHLPRIRTELGRKKLRYAGCIIWKEMLPHIKHVKNINQLKSCVKCILTEQKVNDICF